MKDKIICGYLGPPGTFSQQAVLNYFTDCQNLIPCKSISSIFSAFEDQKINVGVIPVENSLEGAVNVSMDHLFSSELTIIGEVVVPVEHFLITNPGVSLIEINELYSHSQAIAQCSEFINRFLPDAEIFYTQSTALAAKFVKDKRMRAMIGAREVSHINSLEIRAENIQDNLENYTRFLVIGSQQTNEIYNKYHLEKQYKTSIIYAPEVDKVGVLYEILGEFYRENINLTRIESRPTKKQLGEYLFYIDIEGHRLEEGVTRALTGIKKGSSVFKILGSYVKSKVKKRN